MSGHTPDVSTHITSLFAPEFIGSLRESKVPASSTLMCRIHNFLHMERNFPILHPDCTRINGISPSRLVLPMNTMAWSFDDGHSILWISRGCCASNRGKDHKRGQRDVRIVRAVYI